MAGAVPLFEVLGSAPEIREAVVVTREAALPHLPVRDRPTYLLRRREVVVGPDYVCARLRPAVALPVHYEGWSHFAEGRQAIERRLASAPAEVRNRFHWLPIGTPVEAEA